MPRPRSFEEDIEFAKRTHDPMMPLDDDRLSTTSFKITLVNHAQYISLGNDAQYDKMSELRRSPHLVHSGQLLSEYRKHLEHFECDQGNKDDDRAEHFHDQAHGGPRTGAQRRSPAQRCQGTTCSILCTTGPYAHAA